MTDQPLRPADTHEPPRARAYVIVWVALIVLATVTLFASRAPIGDWGLVVALAIASIKAALVLAVFMHLASGRPLHRVVFIVAVGFVVLIVVGMLADVGTRAIASVYVDDGSAAGH